MASGFDLRPLDASFGAAVTGLKLAGLTPETFASLHRAWLEFALLIFPGQHLTPEEQTAFARRFGELEFPLVPVSNVRPDGSLISIEDDDDVAWVLEGNLVWHYDSTYMPVQSKGVVLSAKVVPLAGGGDAVGGHARGLRWPR